MTRSIGAIPCSSIAAACSGLSRCARNDGFKNPSADPAELPADFAAERRNLADDDQLAGPPGLATAIDPQTVLDRQIAATAAEVPRRHAARAEDRAHAVGGRRDFNRRRKVKAHGISRRLANFLAASGDQLIGATQFLAVVAEH